MNAPLSASKTLLKQSKGQIALANVKRQGKGNVTIIPKETISEIKELLEVEVSIKDIAEHFGLSTEQIKWVKNIETSISLNQSKPVAKPVAKKSVPSPAIKTDETKKHDTFYSVAVSKSSYDYISSLKHLGILPTRAKVVEIIVEHIKHDKSFLKKLIK